MSSHSSAYCSASTKLLVPDSWLRFVYIIQSTLRDNHFMGSKQKQLDENHQGRHVDPHLRAPLSETLLHHLRDSDRHLPHARHIQHGHCNWLFESWKKNSAYFSLPIISHRRVMTSSEKTLDAPICPAAARFTHVNIPVAFLWYKTTTIFVKICLIILKIFFS